MQYTPNLYTGKHFSQIFSEIVYSTKTLEKNLVRLMDNVKWEQHVTTMGGDLTVQPYKSRLAETDSQGTIEFSDVTVKPVKSMVYKEFTLEDLRGTRFTEDMKAGAANLESNEFLSAVLAYMQPKIALGAEKSFWAAIKTELNDVASVATKLTGVALTQDNIDEEITKVYNAIDDEILINGDVVIYADYSIKKLIVNNNTSQAYRDKFIVNADSVSYQGVTIEFLPLGANTMIAGRSSDFVWATDLAADMGSLQVEKVQANSDVIFFKGVFTQDQAVIIPEQKVIYSYTAV